MDSDGHVWPSPLLSKETKTYRQQSNDDGEDCCNGEGPACVGFEMFSDLDEEFVFLAAHFAHSLSSSHPTAVPSHASARF